MSAVTVTAAAALAVVGPIPAQPAAAKPSDPASPDGLFDVSFFEARHGWTVGANDTFAVDHRWRAALEAPET